MPVAILLFAAIYVLPDAQLPAPDKAQQQRIADALSQIRTGSDLADRAVRDLALVGDAALPAIIVRINEAGAGERLLLLAAVRRMRHGRVLLKQARSDESPAIRAWLAAPPPRDAADLQQLAASYLDLLALAEEQRRIDVDRDLKGLKPVVGRPMATFSGVRQRMRDRKLADQIQKQRTRAANDFARAGAVALRSGRLQPDVNDPVFMAYLSLVEEEGSPPFYAVPALVSLGARLTPVLHWSLAREHHDPRIMLRLLFAVDPERSIYQHFDTQRPDVQRALVTLAPEDLALLERVALAADGSVRAAALDALLRLEAPAGLAPARKLLDPLAYGPNEFRRAARLLARAGEVKALATWAEVKVPDDGTLRAAQLGKLQQVCASTLRTHGGKAATVLAEGFLKADARRLRILGMDLVLDPQRLLELARAENDEPFAFKLAGRALLVGGASVAPDVLAILKRHGRPVPLSILQALRNKGCVDALVQLAQTQDNALGQLARLPSIDQQHEATLLELHKRAKAALLESHKRAKAAGKAPQGDLSRTLEAILPLGTKSVQEEYLRAAPEDALRALAGGAELNHRAPVSIPLLALVKGATPERLRRINQSASAQPLVEPGLFYALFKAWDAIPSGSQKSASGGPDRQKVIVLATLARSDDRKSAELLFADLLAGRFKDPPYLLGTLRAAARMLPPERLVALLPVLEKLREGEYPLPSRQPPPGDSYRSIMLRAGIAALGVAQADALGSLCDFVLDPKLQWEASEFRHWSFVPYWSLFALRFFPAVKVNVAMRKALKRAEAAGRLAALHPRHLFRMVTYCRQRRQDGRGLYEVGLALCEVLERLPWEGEVQYEKMRAFGGLRRYREAAVAARAAAAKKYARGYTSVDGYRTPAFLEGRARLYDGLAAGKLGDVLPAMGANPILLNLAAWYALLNAPDKPLAQKAAQEAVRLSAGLYHPYRNTLALVRVRQNRPKEALRLLDPRDVLPVERQAGSGWYLYFQAQAEMLLGDPKDARQDLGHALEVDRRLIPTARAEPAFKAFAELFRQVEEDFLDKLFSWEG